MTVVGYARVSTDGQTLDSQVSELRRAGAERIFREKVSGALSNRAQLARALGQLGEGDVLLVTRLDRLARSTRDLLNTLAFRCREGRRLSIDARHLGRYNDTTWPAHADGAGRARRVRAGAHPL